MTPEAGPVLPRKGRWFPCGCGPIRNAHSASTPCQAFRNDLVRVDKCLAAQPVQSLHGLEQIDGIFIEYPQRAR